MWLVKCYFVVKIQEFNASIKDFCCTQKSYISVICTTYYIKIFQGEERLTGSGYDYDGDDDCTESQSNIK